MPVFPRSLKLMMAAAVLVLGSAVSTVSAEVPELQLRWWIDGALAYDSAPAGVDNGNGTYAYNGNFFDAVSGATLTWTLTGDPDPQISGGLAVENPNLPDIDVILEVILPIAPTLPNGSLLIGSAASTLTSEDGGGTFSSLAGTPIWQALIDGAPVGASASLFADPYSLAIPGLGSAGDNANFGIPVPIVGPAILNSIGIRISFNLTQGDQASMTSVFRADAIPGPGGLALLAIGVVVRRRRRRD